MGMLVLSVGVRGMNITVMLYIRRTRQYESA